MKQPEEEKSITSSQKSQPPSFIITRRPSISKTLISNANAQPSLNSRSPMHSPGTQLRLVFHSPKVSENFERTPSSSQNDSSPNPETHQRRVLRLQRSPRITSGPFTLHVQPLNENIQMNEPRKALFQGTLSPLKPLKQQNTPIGFRKQFDAEKTQEGTYFQQMRDQMREHRSPHPLSVNNSGSAKRNTIPWPELSIDTFLWVWLIFND